MWLYSALVTPALLAALLLPTQVSGGLVFSHWWAGVVSACLHSAAGTDTPGSRLLDARGQDPRGVLHQPSRRILRRPERCEPARGSTCASGLRRLGQRVGEHGDQRLELHVRRG